MILNQQRKELREKFPQIAAQFIYKTREKICHRGATPISVGLWQPELGGKSTPTFIFLELH